MYFPLLPRQNQPGFIVTLAPLDYMQASPVKFSIKTDAGYILFIPPNLDSEYWELDGRSSIAQGFYAVYPAAEGLVYYRRFDTYLAGYVISLVTLAWLVVWYRKEAFEKMLARGNRIIRRFQG